MTIRIKTTELPAQTIETVIVSVPDSEWQSMIWKRRLGFAAAPVLVVFGAAGIIPVLNLSPKMIVGLPYMIILWLFAFKVMWRCFQLEARLLEKHGWDGKSNYDVELEYPTPVLE